MFADVPTAPPDKILKLATMYKEDTFPTKVNLGIGAYRTAEGKTWILPSVKAAEEAVCSDSCADKEYQPIDGKPEYKRPVQELIFSPEMIDSGTVVSVQALSGTGSLTIITQFMVNWLGAKKIYIPDPTWGNHPAIFKRAGLSDVEKYPYWDAATKGLAFDGMMATLKAAKPGEVVLLHAVAHNPTGVDPSEDQWKQIVEVCKTNKLIPLLDNAYQGYATGNLARDGLAQDLFAASGLEYFIAQSFAKNFGLYGERIGYIHVKVADKETAPAVLSQMKILVRQCYSSPPRHGAAIVNKILSTPELKNQWLSELSLMSDRIVEMRSALRAALEAKGTPGTWNHVTDQIGMFTYTGLAPEQVERMVNDFHIYMTGDGRISVAGLNPGNVPYVADSMDKVVRGA
jgi:aspartate/tyrosine/aromatic aminotransferase